MFVGLISKTQTLNKKSNSSYMTPFLNCLSALPPSEDMNINVKTNTYSAKKIRGNSREMGGPTRRGLNRTAQRTQVLCLATLLRWYKILILNCNSFLPLNGDGVGLKKRGKAMGFEPRTSNSLKPQIVTHHRHSIMSS